ncbi:MAG: hypothetical protein OEY14_11930 [Myxococcales bacterium]|nr:hypothetical protein [Myxococcales bacterium]
MLLAGLAGLLAVGYGTLALVDDYHLRVAGTWTGVQSAAPAASQHFDNVRRAETAATVAGYAAAAFFLLLTIELASRPRFRKLGWLAILPAAVPVLPIGALVLSLWVGGDYECTSATGAYDRGQQCVEYVAPPPEAWLQRQVVESALRLALIMEVWCVLLVVIWLSIMIAAVVKRLGLRPRRRSDRRSDRG